MRPTHIVLWPALAITIALAGCSSAKPRPSGEATRYEPKPKGCGIDVLEKAPNRPYEEIGSFQQLVTNVPPAGAREVLRDQACELGADAVIVTRHVVTNGFGHVFVAGTAIKYVEPPASPPETPAEEEPAPGSVKL